MIDYEYADGEDAGGGSGFSSEDDMMTSPNGNIFRVTGPLCGEFTGHQWIPLTKASNVELGCFVWSAPKRLNKQSRR